MGRVGDDRIGPYRVVERLGAGGMGEVYKAYDDRLDRWVAIKRIRPDKQQAEENRARFRREARATAKLNHASIVHVYDIFQDGPSDCIVMELIEGESLDRILSDGPIDPLRAADIGRQIAAGLAEAHAKDILHRDLKTENIIISTDQQVKILDFGLAKQLIQGDLDSSLTGKGQVVGTSRAMSPEYVSGDEVDHRADLFALGVLLYETVTGQSPFKAHNTLATLKRVILYRQTPAAEVNPEVPPELSHLIDLLLEKEPNDRPSSAREVAEALARTAGVSSSGAMDRPPMTASSSIEMIAMESAAARRWRNVSLGLLAVLVPIVGFLWLRPTPTPQQVLAFEKTDFLVVGDFANQTGEEALDGTLDSAFRIGLERGRFAKVLAHTQVRASLARMEQPADSAIDRDVGIEIAQREGAKALVLGSIVKVGEAYRLSGEIVDPQSGRSLYAAEAQAAEQNDILAALDEITQDVRANLGESLAGIEQTSEPLAKVTTANLEALHAYSAGNAKFLETKHAEAIPLLLEAVQRDPEFAMAHAKLGTAYRNLANFDKATEHFRLALTQVDRLTTAERLYVDGWMKTWVGTPDEMIAAWAVMQNLFPERFDGHHNLAMVYWEHFNDFEAAVEPMTQAADVGQGTMRAFALERLGFLYLALGNDDDARKAFAEMRQIDPRASLAGPAMEETVLRDHPATEALLAEMDRAADERERLNANLIRGLFALSRGALAEAKAAAVTGIQRADTTSWVVAALEHRLLLLAALALESDDAALRGALDEATARAMGLLTAAPSELGFSPEPLLAVLGKLHARHGDLAAAMSLLRELESHTEYSGFPSWQAYTELLRGEIAAREDRMDEAFEALQRSLQALDTMQARESLAKVAWRSGDRAFALAQYTWIGEHGGRAFAEGKDVRFDRPLNVAAWSMASYHRGRLLAEEGDEEAAREALNAFLETWDGSTDSAAIRETRRLLATLEAA